MAVEAPPSGATARRRHPARWAALGVGAVVLVLVAVLVTREPADTRITKSPLVGEPAPAIQAETLDGGTLDVAAYRGEWLLVNFFASWCTPCIKEHPELVRWSEERGAAGTGSVVSVVFQDDPENVQGFFERNGGDWPVVRDEDGEVTLEYGVAKLPESYLVAPDGIVRAKITGGITADALDAVIADIESGEM